MKKNVLLKQCQLGAISAKYCFQNNYGFGPNQLVFGKNPNLLNGPENKPPLLENVTISELVPNNLNAIDAARKAFVEIDNDN